MLNVAANLKFIYKIGKAAGNFEAGTVIVFDSDADDVVIKRNMPATKRYNSEEIEVPLTRSSVTTGSLRITYDGDIRNTYECETALKEKICGCSRNDERKNG